MLEAWVIALEIRVAALENRIPGPTPPIDIAEAKQEYGAYWSPFQGPAWRCGYSALDPDRVIPSPDSVAEPATRLGAHDPLLIDFLALNRGRMGPANRTQGYNAVSLNAAILLCYLFKTDAWPLDRWIAHSLRDLAEVNGLTHGGTRKATGHLLRWKFLNATGRHRPWRTGSPRIATASASNRSGRCCPNAARPCSQTRCGAYALSAVTFPGLDTCNDTPIPRYR